MPATAHQHFQEDIARAKAIVAHTDPLPCTNAAEQLLRSDLLRSAWMFAVGALDAYFCDAYTDLVAVTASSKSRQPAITLPEWVYDIKFPLRAVLEKYDNTNWRWRMAARKLMEHEIVIRLLLAPRCPGSGFLKLRFLRSLRGKPLAAMKKTLAALADILRARSARKGPMSVYERAIPNIRPAVCIGFPCLRCGLE